MNEKKCLVFLFIITSMIYGEMWIETTQQDFKDGIFEHNIYASNKYGGTVEFVNRWDLNCDGYFDLIVSNEMASFSYVYWGSASGYNPSNMTQYPVDNSGDCEVGDLNFDGYPELIFTNGAGNTLRIFTGTTSGPNPNSYVDVPLSTGSEACYLADFNKDGYLDLVSSRYNYNNGVVFWGSASGYSPGNATFLPSNGNHNVESGDFNKDGWLDIVFINYVGSNTYVYWGSAAGFSPNAKVELPNPQVYPHGCSVADVNNDDYLDIVITYFSGGNQSYIYTYTPNGFVLWQTLMPGPCYGGSSIADFNADGYLDIIYLRGYGVNLKPKIYWGSTTGYSETNTTEIGQPVDASGGFVADFNGDNIFDVFVNNYAYPPEPSYILLSPSYTPTYSLPTQRDHHGMFREIGNVYNRKYYEDYISSVFDAGEEVAWGIVDWDDSLPPGSNISFFVRSGNTPNPDNSWSGWDSLGKGEDIPDSLNSRYLQYQARLKYTNPAYLPYLYEVRIGYGPTVRLILEPNQVDSTLPNVRIDYDIRVINIGIGLDTVDLVYQHTTNWQIDLFDSTGNNPLIDHNNNSIPDVIININDTVPIVLGVTPPSNAQGGEIDSLRLIGNSNINPALMDTVFITTKIRRVVAILVEPDQVGYTVAGVPRSYDLWVYNQGTNRDTVDLYYNHNRPWGVVLLDSLGMPLADHNNNGLVDLWVNNSDSVRFRLFIYSPDTASVGVADTLILTGRSSLNPAITDNARIITIIEGMGSII
ncbi:MAG: VCBS repeat-containing protein, partial [candidate division WOR-3 bacterium]